MVPPPVVLELAEDEDEPPPPRRGWVRLLLIVILLGWLMVFAVAVWLDPYRDGKVWLDATHTQLHLPPCHFKKLTGLPCPSCGMTSSFALLMHGDVLDSLRANFAGTLLAAIGLAYVPWSMLSMLRGRWVWIRDVEGVLLRLVILFVVTMMLRWVGVLAWHYFGG
jgi:hypothetical protein